jgi:hypothetical protein
MNPLPDLFVITRTDAPAQHADRVFLLHDDGRVMWHNTPTVFLSFAEAEAFAATHHYLCPKDSFSWFVRRYESDVNKHLIPSDPEPAPKTVTISRSPTVPCGFLLTCSDGRTAINTLDHEFPSLAQSFGWSFSAIRWEGSRCKHIDTDGSFDCGVCGLPVSVMIDEARKYLTDNCPITVPDPGYFAKTDTRCG